ncbi:MAG: hypothetical protein WDN04_27390 [Rhodospirillales bacterium]
MIRSILAAAALWFCAAHVALAQSDPGPFGAKYCTATGGAVQTRIPTYGTNGGTPLTLSGPRKFCAYTAKDGSSIYLLLNTLITKQPTLAALAYYAEVPYDGSTCKGSPGSCYCSQLGGTDLFGGINLAGGGWVLSTDSTDVLDACIFPDLSSIDSYGLFYHSANIIRGHDLAKVLRYKNPN